MGEVCQESRRAQSGAGDRQWRRQWRLLSPAAASRGRSEANMAQQIATTFELTDADRALASEVLSGAAEVVSIAKLGEPERAVALREAGALITGNFTKDLRPHELAL